MFRIDRRLMQNAGDGGGTGGPTPPNTLASRAPSGDNLTQNAEKTSKASAALEAASKGLKASYDLLFGTSKTPFSDFVGATEGISNSLAKALGFSDKVKENLAKTAGIASVSAKEFLTLRDRMAAYQKVAVESSVATFGIGTTMSRSTDLFEEFGQGAISVQKITGESLEQIGTKFKALTNDTLMISGGFKENVDQATRVKNAYTALGQATALTTSTGMGFNDYVTTSNNLLRKQGVTIEETNKMFAAASKEIANTGASMSDLSGHITSLTNSSEYLQYDLGKMTGVLSGVARAQKEMIEAGEKYTFKSPQQAMESYSRVLQNTMSHQKDFAQALFYSSVQGKGLGDALEFMFDTDPTKALQASMDSLKEAFGGELLTLEQARASGREEEFMGQSYYMQKQLGLQSPQEYQSFLKSYQKGAPLEKALAEAKETREKTGDDALREMNKAMDEFYPKMMDQDELRNKYLGNIAINTAISAKSLADKAFGGSTTFEAIQQVTKGTPADLKDKVENTSAWSGFKKFFSSGDKSSKVSPDLETPTTPTSTRSSIPPTTPKEPSIPTTANQALQEAFELNKKQQEGSRQAALKAAEANKKEADAKEKAIVATEKSKSETSKLTDAQKKQQIEEERRKRNVQFSTQSGNTLFTFDSTKDSRKGTGSGVMWKDQVSAANQTRQIDYASLIPESTPLTTVEPPTPSKGVAPTIPQAAKTTDTRPIAVARSEAKANQEKSTNRDERSSAMLANNQPATPQNITVNLQIGADIIATKVIEIADPRYVQRSKVDQQQSRNV